MTFVTMDHKVGVVDVNLPSGNNEKINCAILCADVAGYTKFCAIDETWTHKQLAIRFKEFEEIAHKRNGHIARLRGDSIILLLEDSERAVFCAMEMQKATEIQNQALPKDKKIYFRVAVHTGTVIFDNNEPYGNVVNYAVRLQQIAKPGSIYVSESAKNSLKHYFPLCFDQVSKFKSISINKSKTLQHIYEPIKNFANAETKRTYRQVYLNSFFTMAIVMIALYANPLSDTKHPSYNTIEYFPKSNYSDSTSNFQTHNELAHVPNAADHQYFNEPFISLYQNLMPNYENYEIIHDFYDSTKDKTKLSEFDLIIKEQNKKLKISETLYASVIEELEDIKNVNVSLMDRNTELLKMLASMNKHNSADNHHYPKYKLAKTIEATKPNASNQLNFYIDVDTKLVVSPYITLKTVNDTKKWLTKELTYLITKYAKDKHAQHIIHTNQNSTEKFSCKRNNNQLNYKEFILIKPTIVSYSHSWKRIEINLINCHNATNQNVTFDNFPPVPMQEGKNKLWSNTNTRERLQKLISANIDKISNNQSHGNI